MANTICSARGITRLFGEARRSARTPSRSSSQTSGFAHHQPLDRVALHDRLQLVDQAAREMASQVLRKRLVDAPRDLEIVTLGVARIRRIDAEHEDRARFVR